MNKNQGKTLGNQQDQLNPSAKSVGIIDVDEEKGTTTSAKLVGIVVAATPFNTPAATPANKTIIALKVRDAVIVAPSPKGASTHEPLLRYAHEKLPKIGAPCDLVQILPKFNKEIIYELMKQADCALPSPNKTLRPSLGRGTLTKEVCIPRHVRAVV